MEHPATGNEPPAPAPQPAPEWDSSDPQLAFAHTQARRLAEKFAIGEDHAWQLIHLFRGDRDALERAAAL